MLKGRQVGDRRLNRPSIEMIQTEKARYRLLMLLASTKLMVKQIQGVTKSFKLREIFPAVILTRLRRL